MIEISFLGSGSSGNCAVIRTEKTAVLVDAGLSRRAIETRLLALGVALETVAALFLTHEHSDHSRTALDLSEELGIPIYTTPGTAGAARFPGPLFADVRPIRPGKDVVVNDLNVRVAATPHDGAEPVCFVFEEGGGRRVAVATDLGHVSMPVRAALSGCEVIGLEANHDVELLRLGPYPFYLKQRVLSAVGHLSNEAAAEAIADAVGPRTSAVVLLHVSQQNNTPALARRATETVFARRGIEAALDVAPPAGPTPWRRA